MTEKEMTKALAEEILKNPDAQLLIWDEDDYYPIGKLVITCDIGCPNVYTIRIRTKKPPKQD